jgi:hypothetical protein
VSINGFLDIIADVRNIYALIKWCMKKSLFLWIVIVGLHATELSGQVPDTTKIEEDIWDDDDDLDFSLYDDIEFADEGARRYATARVFDLSPQRFISIHWDAMFRHNMEFSSLGSFPPGSEGNISERSTVNYAGGLRLIANIPVISKSSIIWQMGANYWNTSYSVSNIENLSPNLPVANLSHTLNQDGLRTAGINTTIFKPLNEEQFLLFQGSADLSGNYTFSEFQSLRYLRYSAAIMWGKKPNDRLQWAVGVARTYRVGELNYLPVVLYNYTAPSRKWGLEILAPARAHYRRTFNPRSILLAGYELEGQSHRIRQLSTENQSFEIRRGELRFRTEYMTQLTGFFWLSIQGGLRYDYIFHADYLPDGRDFFRGFFGDQPYAMLNNLGMPLYFNIGIHLLSP